MSRSSEQILVSELSGIGPVSAQWLEEIDILTRADLEKAGPVLVYRVLKDRRNVSLNLLYALYGALTGERWDRLPAKTRKRLKREAEKGLQRLPDRAT